MSDALAVSIAAPRTEHDSIIRVAIAPIVAALAGAAELDAISFERFNKPDWGVRLRVLGGREWLRGVARLEVERQLSSVGRTFTFVEAAAEDKWIGGREDESLLKTIDHADSTACLALMEAEAGGSLSTSRAQWSLLVVEAMLDLFGLTGDDRLGFYRRGWEWAPDAGRWDDEVFAALEDKYEAQRDALRVALSGPTTETWGGSVPERIATTLLSSVHEPIVAIRTGEAGPTPKSVVDLALLVGHAHSNRLGIHATQEATIRYLVWRARGGRRPSTS